MCEIVDLQALWQEMRVVWEQPLTLKVYITVRCLCGHKKVLRWSSAPSFMDAIKFHANHICYDCWKIFKRNENIAISDILGLPKLRGSRKQYMAGINIRAEFAIQLVGDGFDEQNIKCFLKQQTEAGWWIDNKHKLSTLFDIQASVKDTKPEKEVKRYCAVKLLNMLLDQIKL